MVLYFTRNRPQVKRICVSWCKYRFLENYLVIPTFLTHTDSHLVRWAACFNYFIVSDKVLVHLSVCCAGIVNLDHYRIICQWKRMIKESHWLYEKNFSNFLSLNKAMNKNSHCECDKKINYFLNNNNNQQVCLLIFLSLF